MIDLFRVLKLVAKALEKQKVRYALVGGMASNLWVAKEKTSETFDVDFMIHGMSDVIIDATAAAIEPHFESVLRSPNLEFKRIHLKRLLVNDTMVDFLEARSAALMNSIFARTGNVPLANANIPIVTPEDVFILKGMSLREKDIAAMTWLAETKDFDQQYAEKWARQLGIWSFSRRAFPRYRRGDKN